MSDYWIAREKILNAVKANDDKQLKMLAQAHPDAFKNVVAQARNALKKPAIRSR